ncbi:Lipopolysaccharide kinase (Kdo/WaaP) family protein [Atopomonas hussainii]|uniref:Lipopolysaccharide kinase (Kdo/WaaP) family protein n=1 Tax=Atopomonas hussainii TaxID=1429083 RepID=A0A1H7HIW5_9GAMM|nr:lipopolysaccharide kinase InaA family protein [Atopomonas hussainii]SEK50209.1 Lipopolysaccharide kinase (Kdo/WaaP) family protein [Atopomonas hussainii]
MSLALLRKAGRNPALPMSVPLADQSVLLEQWLRVLPGKRYVARAQWQGQTVLAKLLVGDKAARDAQQERDGFAALQQAGVATPELLTSGQNEHGAWLLYRFIEQGQSLGTRWQALAAQPLLSAEQATLLQKALTCIGQLHAQGLWQEDLHLDNLLADGAQLYLIDAGGIRQQALGQPLSAAQCQANLAVFFAQLPPLSDDQLELLLVSYMAHNPQAIALDALREAERKLRQWRLRDYLKKCARDCSLFAFSKSATGILAVRREWLTVLAPLLAEPDRFIDAGHIYKTGGAATVARVEVDGRPLLVKRYNIKNTAHWLKRCWRPSRAWHSWIEGNRLLHLGIATPTPLAVIERRSWGLRRTAYLITEYCPGGDIIARFDPAGQQLPPDDELAALAQLLTQMKAQRLSHGDLKGHNVFWMASGFGLIDLDAMQQHRCQRRFAKAFARDRARLLRNWPSDSPLHKQLDHVLPTAD